MTVTSAGDLNPLDLEGRLALRRRLPPPKVRRALREASGLSGAEFAAGLGVSRQALSHWERGTRTPRPAQMRRYVEALELVAGTSG